MQIIIDIPNSLYANLKKIKGDSVAGKRIIDCVINGTPLPKGHKRLIEDNFEVGPVFDDEGCRISYKYVTQEDLNNAPTIIPAGKEEV